MADTKISALTELTVGNVADGDLFVEVDVSDTSMAASGTDKKVLASTVKHYVTGATKTPATLTGSPTLTAWYKPESLTGSDGDLIGTWADSSGNALDLTQGTSGKKPILKTSRPEFGGFNVARFDGTDDTLVKTTTGLSASYTWSGAIVVFPTSTSGPQYWDLRGTNYFDFYNSTGKWLARGGSASANSANANTDSLNGVFFAIVTMSSTRGVLYLNGRPFGRWDVDAQVTPSNFYLGSNADSGAYLNGDVAEFVIWNATLTTQQVREVTSYFATRYVHAMVIP